MLKNQEILGPKRLNDPDMRGAEKAIHRAALKARERARRFGHGIIIYENGKIVEKHPDKNDWRFSPWSDKAHSFYLSSIEVIATWESP